MRRLRSTAYLLVLISLCSPFSGADTPRVEEDLAFFSGLSSRDDGSEGEAEAFAYIAERLEELDVSFEDVPLGLIDGGHSFSRNLTAVIPGNHPGRIILAAPVDGGAFSVSFLLELAEHLRLSPPKHDIQLAFLGAEKGDTDFHPYGGRMEVERLADSGLDSGVLLLYLDSEEMPSRWQLRPGGNGIISPRWLVETLSEALSGQFVDFRLRGTDIQIARLGLQGDVRTMTPWMEADIPSLMFSGQGNATGGDRVRFVERFIESITNLDARLDVIPDNLQSSYLFIRPLSDMHPQIVRELPYVVAFLAITAILLLAMLSRYRAVVLNIRRFASRLWAWPLLIVLVFLYFFLSTLFVEETLLLIDFPELWKHSPGIFVFFKLSVTLALSLIFILITRGLPLPRSPHFYSYGALLTAGLGVLVFMSLDITLAGFSVLTLILLMLFLATRKLRWKTFFLILSFIPYLMALVVIISEPYEVIIEAILLNRIGGSIVLTFILMPMILAMTSLSYWRVHYSRSRGSVMTPLGTLILSISAVITLTWILNSDPYGPASLQPVTLTDSIDMNTGGRRLQVSSPAPIGNAGLVLDGATYPLEDLGRHAEVRTPLNRTPVEINHTSRNFLGRRTIRTTISGEESPDSLVITLNSEEPFTVHDCDFPFEQSADGTSASLYIGSHPPFPLNIAFTVNGDAVLDMYCRVIWRAPLDPPGIDRRDLAISGSRVATITQSLD